MVIEYNDPIIVNKYENPNFAIKFPRSKKGVATLSFPQGIEFDKNFWWFYILSRVDSCKKTADRNFFPDGLDTALTICTMAVLAVMPDSL